MQPLYQQISHMLICTKSDNDIFFEKLGKCFYLFICLFILFTLENGNYVKGIETIRIKETPVIRQCIFTQLLY